MPLFPHSGCGHPAGTLVACQARRPMCEMAVVHCSRLWRGNTATHCLCTLHPMCWLVGVLVGGCDKLFGACVG